MVFKAEYRVDTPGSFKEIASTINRENHKLLQSYCLPSTITYIFQKNTQLESISKTISNNLYSPPYSHQYFAYKWSTVKTGIIESCAMSLRIPYFRKRRAKTPVK